MKNKKINFTSAKAEERYYIIKMHGGLEPETFGPYKTEKKQDEAAKEIHQKMKDEDNLFALDIIIRYSPSGGLIVDPVGWCYSGGFFQDEGR